MEGSGVDFNVPPPPPFLTLLFFFFIFFEAAMGGEVGLSPIPKKARIGVYASLGGARDRGFLELYGKSRFGETLVEV